MPDTRVFAGPGADNWVTATPIAGDTAKFTGNAASMTEDYAAIDDVDLAAVQFDVTYGGTVGTENSGWALECNGPVTNSSRSPFIHLTGGDTEDIVRIIHAPIDNTGELLVSAATVGYVICGGGKMTVRGDVTVDEATAVGTGYLVLLAGAGGYGELAAHGRSQVDVEEDPATNGISVYDNATVRVLHADAAPQVSQYGGTVEFRGATLAGYVGMGGHLDLSQATSDVDFGGFTCVVGPDLRITPPPEPYVMTAGATVTFVGGKPRGWRIG